MQWCVGVLQRIVPLSGMPPPSAPPSPPPHRPHLPGLPFEVEGVVQVQKVTHHVQAHAPGGARGKREGGGKGTEECSIREWQGPPPRDVTRA